MTPHDHHTNKVTWPGSSLPTANQGRQASVVKSGNLARQGSAAMREQGTSACGHAADDSNRVLTHLQHDANGLHGAPSFRLGHGRMMDYACGTVNIDRLTMSLGADTDQRWRAIIHVSDPPASPPSPALRCRQCQAASSVLSSALDFFFSFRLGVRRFCRGASAGHVCMMSVLAAQVVELAVSVGGEGEDSGVSVLSEQDRQLSEQDRRTYVRTGQTYNCQDSQNVRT